MEKMLSCLWDWQLEWGLYRLLADMFPATRRHNKKGEGELKWERAKEFLWPASPLCLSYYRADKPRFVREIMLAGFLSLATKSVLSDTPGDSLVMLIGYSYLTLAAAHTVPVSSILLTGWEEELGPIKSSLALVLPLFRGWYYKWKACWFLESKPPGLNPSSVSKWMSNPVQLINLWDATT